MNYYTIYRAKDDEIIASGTSKECTEIMRLSSVASFYCLVCRARQGKNRKYEVIVDEGSECANE